MFATRDREPMQLLAGKAGLLTLPGPRLLAIATPAENSL
jgi:hypothetical protein